MLFFLVLHRNGQSRNAMLEKVMVISITTLTVDVHGLKIGIFTFHFVSGFPVASQLAGRCSRNRMKMSITDTRMENPTV
jgi:hypothetical protein